MLSDTKRDCINYAKELGDYQKMSVETLANGYCAAIDASDEDKKNSYLSALILRFWYRIDKMYTENKNTGLDREDFFFWLVEAIEYACKYRAWQTKSTNAQACINKCIETIRLQHYYEFNLDKHRANYNTISLDAPLEGEDDENKNTALDILVADDQIGSYESNFAIESLVQHYINNKKLIEAIIIDNIAFNDAEKITREKVVEFDPNSEKQVKHNVYYHEFWPFKLVQILNSLSDEYANYFTSKYRINNMELSAALQSVKESNNQKLYKSIDKTLAELRRTMLAD